MSQAIQHLSGPVRALFSDLDGTLTTDGRLEPATYAALGRLADAGIPVVIVTGRPSGWGQALMSIAPVAAVVSENGGVSFVSSGNRTEKLYGVPQDEVAPWRQKMHAALAHVKQEIPGTQLSSDSCYREVDLAIDWNEEVSLTVEDAERAAALLRSHGFSAWRSSVHVNFSPPAFDKLSGCKTIVERVFDGDAEDLSSYVYVGDALNDAPMFRGFANSVGVANVRDWWDLLAHKPAFVTKEREGAGFRELVTHLVGLNGH